MPKLSLPEIRALLDEAKAAYKAKFTTGFYHGTGANDIEAFNPLKNKDPNKLETPGVTFATRDTDFAESFLPGSNRGGYKSGATMYPVSINLGKHWHPNTPEGKQVVSDYIDKMYPYEANPKDLVGVKKQMLEASWEDIENPNFIKHLQDTGHDSFHVMEGGIPNVGVFEPHNIRGKFAEYNPDEAMNPDFMKAAGGSVEGYAGGGEVLKKILKFAEDVPFIHYSNHPSLNRLEPSMYGRGIKGQEAARLKDAPDIKDRSYFYVNKGEQTMPPEQGLGSQKYQGTASNVYNAAEDPEGFHAIAKSRALDPYMMSFGREMVDPAVKATELERLIKGAGYEGYHTGDVGLMFHPTPVSKID